LFFLPTAFSFFGGWWRKAGNCGLSGEKRIPSCLKRHAENQPEAPMAVDKFFVFVGKSPQNKAFAPAPVKGFSVFPDQNAEAYSFVVKPA